MGEDSFAQQVSQKLQCEVIAANDDVFLRGEEGVAFVGEYGKDSKDWRTFEKGEEVKNER